MDFDILTSYSFLVIALGTSCLGFASGMIGTISVLKKQSLIGDAIGHSSFPGIILAFMIFMMRDSGILILGAIVSGILSFILIQVISSFSKVNLDTALAILLSTMFGFGMVLKSYISGNRNYTGVTQAGLANYIFGQAAYMLEIDVQYIIIASIIAIIFLLIFYKEIKLYIFDSIYSKTAGFKPTFISLIIILMTMVLISVGLKAVGAILISSMLIIPGIIGMQWSVRFHRVLLIAGFSGAISGFIGAYLSQVGRGLSTGPIIIVVMCILAIISVVFGRYGIIVKFIAKRRARHE